MATPAPAETPPATAIDVSPTPTPSLAELTAIVRVPPYAELVHLFDYDRQAPLDIQVESVDEERGVKRYDLTYASPKGGRVPAYLTVPNGAGPFAALILQPGLGGRRQDMRDFGAALARTGMVVLTIDAPFARPESLRPACCALTFREQDRDEQIQLVIDLRRGVDLLIARREVDPHRIAYSGVSYGGIIGGLLAGIEHRIRAYNLAVANGGVVTGVGPGRILEGVFRSFPREQQERWVHAMWPIEPIHFVGHAAPSALFFQSGLQDENILVEDARRFQQAGSEPKRIKWYDAGHALNEEAVFDLLAWLKEQVGIDPGKFSTEGLRR